MTGLTGQKKNTHAMNASTLVQKLWNYCNVLRDDGMSYGDYVEQLTYLLFLKMADERSKPPYNQPSIVPAGYSWPELLKRDGDGLFDHYRFRAGESKATADKPLVLKQSAAWADPYYDPQNIKFTERTLFAKSGTALEAVVA